MQGGLANPLLIFRIGIGVQQTDGKGLRPAAHHTRQHGFNIVLRERHQHLAVVVEALRDAKPMPSRYQWWQFRHKRIVEIGPRLTADFQHILKPFGRDQRGAGAFAFEQSIGRDRRTVYNIDIRQ